MEIETIEFNGKQYPKFQSESFAAQFTFAFAQKMCRGEGYDIGCNRIEWSFPGSIPIDKSFGDKILLLGPQQKTFHHENFDALNLPDEKVDYIFSSHCLEHLHDWVRVLDYWTSKLKKGGILYLYLPVYGQEYWRPWNNKKHVNILTPEMILDYVKASGYTLAYATGTDLNHSFTIVAQL